MSLALIASPPAGATLAAMLVVFVEHRLVAGAAIGPLRRPCGRA